jgi:hypothetical protein
MSGSKEQATSIASQTMNSALVAPQWGPAPDILPAGIQGAIPLWRSDRAWRIAISAHHNMPRMNPLPWGHLRPQGQTRLPVQDD